ncbi:glycosyltransferase family 1 protein [Aureobasidium subglaciale EXF-2481]|uniref:Glycosyltransferase family 1 protein n=1 Tax=Aureobasidium subglaciale (strain EXF-2481) TaxID=1043005 RepID=A0A074YR88_AURSE|nr:glycosyltransferase family 1 protein [Aureobasidium subglaciale EXF-2481]KAI5203536.1 UDP-Glycosyltransferase/glycogen phosphorylase [Aureobasidium subglaciale]KAI5222012.1 UDP-Glycosyltransferase/glycogen phosphorylase [Aureobasidium subglaciale]KAI5225905.1 UDP-Glycosyltransferase/glycogen phosphorylase [Aureobasidium subglaciale]KAI5261904.1 UDP-Glycosyltransferase/glycogen phosphorylase [Aureobasidium subglaciale]KEQ98659.1 glycosyltransferase family 1 protein [Aureobasidium subglaciale
MSTSEATTKSLGEAEKSLVLTDSNGEALVPTVVPPETQFPPHGIDGDQSHSVYQTPATAPLQASEDEGYFGGQSQQNNNLDRNIERTDHAKTPANAPGLTNTQSLPTGDRPSLERSWQTERPKAMPRSATIMNALQRSTSHTQHTQHTDDDSESSSSSSDSDSGKQKRRQMKREKSNTKVNVDQAEGKASKRDGRLNISVSETANNGYIAKTFGQTIQNHLGVPHKHASRDEQGSESSSEEHHIKADDDSQDGFSDDAASIASSFHETVKRPRLNIVIMVIGSRGDIQPFLQIARILKRYGHRVRIATHPAFKDFIEKDVGLEFFSIGGDPSELMAFMVKNPGLIPSLETVRQGEIARRRKGMAEIFEGLWRACVNATDDEHDKANMKMLGNKAPFVADAIIANPPSFAHVHIAERLGIPLHIMFTFPYSPTQSFPHPLANISPQKSNTSVEYVNFMSYPLVEMMTWQGLGDLVNKFRVKTLGLEPVSSLWAPGALYRMKVPYTYLWSPGLVPKPKDWGPEIDIAGYVFLDLASDYDPPKELTDFLDAGEPPIYIGFGSIVVDDPDKFTKMIFDAVKIAGVRALVSKGWGGLGGDNTPDNIFMLENTPHDWLFPRVKAVVHHGGAGTAAAGLKAGKPTMIVPFFGDQPFWGAMVSKAKAGAHESIPYKKLDAEKLAEGIKQCLTDDARKNAEEIAESIAAEGDGAENAVKSFHRSLPFAGRHSMRCSILEDRVAVWKMKSSNLRLSALAADILIERKKISWKELRLLRHYEWSDFDGAGEPISGAAGALLKTGTGIARGVGMVPTSVAKNFRKRDEREKKKKERAERKEQKKLLKEAAQGNTSTGGNQDSNRPAGPMHTSTNTTLGSVQSVDDEPLARELAAEFGDAFVESGGALASMPLDLGLAIGQGFHNAPRLYGDASVRKPIRITGMHSGSRAAGQELFYGIYDGWTGLVTQPMHGWQDGKSKHGKFTGLGIGCARGIGGFVLKDISAIITPPFFLAQGVRKEITKRIGGPGTTSFIRRAHIIQGQKDMQALRETDQKNKKNDTQKTERMVDEGWKVMKEAWDVKKKHERHNGGRIRGRLSVSKEEHKWEENGALENVSATRRAIEAEKEGKDIEKVFSQRRKEMRIAEQPRASAMDQPDDYEHSDAVAPNGQTLDRPREEMHHQSMHGNREQRGGNEAGPEDTGAIDASGETEGTKAHAEKSSLDSDTAVESPEEDTASGKIGGDGIDRMQKATKKIEGGWGPNADRQHTQKQAMAG